MGDPMEPVRGPGGPNPKLPWEPPTIKYLGNVRKLVRQGTTKGPSPFDADPDVIQQLPPGQEP